MGLWDRFRGKGQQAGAASPSVEKGATIRQFEAAPAPMRDPAVPVTAPNELLGGVYPIVRLLGRGGFGEVYLCKQPAWNIEVAIKVPNQEALAQADILRWLQREAEAWTNLGLHPNIAYCYHLHPVGDVPLLVVEYVPGGTLLDYLRHKDNPAANNPRASLDMALQMCHALDHAHAHGVVHRDLKPENMLLTADGMVKLTDFGIAQIGAVSTEGHLGTPVAGNRRSFWGGTEGYAAPEQFDRSREIDNRADLFGLGVCLYELFCGRRPYATTFGPKQIAPDPAQLRRDGKLSVGLAPLLRRLVAWEASERPSNAKAVAGELAKIYMDAYAEPSLHAELPPLELTASGHNNRGVSYHFLGKTEQAEAAFAQALTADPLHPEATYNHGVLRWRCGDLTDNDLLRKLEQIRSSNGNWRTAYLLGLVHIERHDLNGAEKILAEATKMVSDQKEVATAIQQVKEIPNWQVPSPIGIFEGHTSWVESIAISPDGRRALSGGRDKTLRVWDVAGKKSLLILHNPADTVRALSISPDGAMALSGGKDKTIYLWDLTVGTCLRNFEGHPGWVDSVAFSPCGQYALSGHWDKMLRLWDVASGKCIRILEGHTSWVRSVKFMPDGRRALSGSNDCRLRLWDIGSGQCLRIFDGHTYSVESIDISRDGGFALSGSIDKTIRLWNLESGQCLRIFQGHTDLVESVAFSSDGRFALSGGNDKTIRLWDIGSGQCLRTIEVRARYFVFSPDGRNVLYGYQDDSVQCGAEIVRNTDNTVRAWALGGGWGDYQSSLQLAKPELLTDLFDSSKIRLSILAKVNSEIAAGRLDKALQAVAKFEAFPGQQRNPDIVSARRRLTSLCMQGSLRSVWPLQMLSGHTDPVSSMAFSLDGKLVLSGSFDNTLRLWNMEDGKCLRIFDGHKNSVTSVAYSPDGRFALSGSHDKTLRLWDLKNGKYLQALADEGYMDITWSTAISPDSKFALSGCHNGDVILWDILNGKYLCTFDDGHNESVVSVVFSPDGSLALSASIDSSIQLIDLMGYHWVRYLEGHNDGVISVVFSPDGRFALSGSDDRTLRLWNVGNGECIRVFYGHTAGVRSVMFLPDGQKAISAGCDDTIRLWDIKSGECLYVIHGKKGAGNGIVALSPDATTLLADDGTSIQVWNLDWELLLPHGE